MAGYTAANNIFGFLYVSVNAITQACMSFTSQNYGLRKLKRMDKILMDCLILTVVVSLVLGGGVYLFGAEILRLYTEEAEVIRCGIEIFAYTTVTYFLCGIMDLFPGDSVGDGSFNSTDDLIRYWYSGNKNCMGVLVVPGSPFAGISVYFISGIMAHYNCDASYLLLFCEEKSAWVTVGYAKI